MAQLPCIKQYVDLLGQRLKSIITMTNNLTGITSFK